MHKLCARFESAESMNLRTGTAERRDDSVDASSIVGRSPAMRTVLRAVDRLASTDLTVTIEGESGSGKETVARALHDRGRGRNAPFVAVDLAETPPGLIESELFDHDGRALDGAGRFARAAGGTLFLDEIGDMPPEAQTRLSRVLRGRAAAPMGSRRTARAAPRIVAATRRDLADAARRGAFREDLFYRLNVAPIRLPPLRERKEDIRPLVRHFLRRAANDGPASTAMTPEAIEALEEHDWPGNVRELENLVRRLATLRPDETIGRADVPPEVARGRACSTPRSGSLSESIENHLETYFDNHTAALPPPGLYERTLRELERPLLALTLDATQGNQLRAAEILGINRNTLRKKLREHDIAATRGRGANR